jgi:hypothetical protein
MQWPEGWKPVWTRLGDPDWKGYRYVLSAAHEVVEVARVVAWMRIRVHRAHYGATKAWWLRLETIHRDGEEDHRMNGSLREVKDFAEQWFIQRMNVELLADAEARLIGGPYP